MNQVTDPESGGTIEAVRLIGEEEKVFVYYIFIHIPYNKIITRNYHALLHC